MKSLGMKGLLGLVFVGLLWGCEDDADEKSSQGEETGECFPNNTCNPGLTCLSNICVNENPSAVGGTGNLGSGGGSTASGGDGPGAGGAETTGPDACLACGEAECAAEVEACEAEAGCADALECVAGCFGASDCNCDFTALGVDALLAISEWSACVAVPCLDACSAPAGGTGGSSGSGGNTGTGNACDTLDESQGSCADSSLEVCDGTEWQRQDCAGCGIVAPTAECAQISVLTFEERAGDEIAAIEGDVRDVVETADLVGAEWYLEAGQMGVIQFVAASPIDASRVKLSGSTSGVGFITLETENGTSGCQYQLSGTQLSHYYILNSSTGDIDWAGCWGEFEDYDINTDPTTATILSIRTDVATTNEIVTLNLSQILL